MKVILKEYKHNTQVGKEFSISHKKNDQEGK
jgi:hypothetical protein